MFIAKHKNDIIWLEYTQVPKSLCKFTLSWGLDIDGGTMWGAGDNI